MTTPEYGSNAPIGYKEASERGVELKDGKWVPIQDNEEKDLLNIAKLLHRSNNG